MPPAEVAIEGVGVMVPSGGEGGTTLGVFLLERWEWLR